MTLWAFWSWMASRLWVGRHVCTWPENHRYSYQGTHHSHWIGVEICRKVLKLVAETCKDRGFLMFPVKISPFTHPLRVSINGGTLSHHPFVDGIFHDINQALPPWPPPFSTGRARSAAIAALDEQLWITDQRRGFPCGFHGGDTHSWMVVHWTYHTGWWFGGSPKY